MKLSELMQGRTPDPNYQGFIVNDDFVLAIDCSDQANSNIANFNVVQMGVTGLDAQMNPVTQDKQYIRAGQSTIKTGTQRAFKVSGDRYVGDDFQDFALSHKIKYGTGSQVIRPYVYFCVLTGKGESGSASIIVNSDGAGEAGESAEIDIEIRKAGDIPLEFSYSTGVGT